MARCWAMSPTVDRLRRAPIGTLNVGGNYTQASTATLTAEVSPTAASQLRVAGSAALNGTLAIVYAPGTYGPTQYTRPGAYAGTQYTLLTAANGITGTFRQVTSVGAQNVGVLTPSVVYGANTVLLTLAAP